MDGKTAGRTIAAACTYDRFYFHDIRTPVKYLGTALQFVQGRIERNETQQAVDAIQQMTSTITRLDQHISNIVSFIKPEVYGNHGSFSLVNLYELTSARAAIFKNVVETCGKNIRIQIPERQTVQTNPDLLGVVLHNLIDNAIKVSSAGVISIHTLLKDNRLHLIVSDQGPGLPEALLYWFNSISATESSPLPEQYNGLGFPMVKEIAKLLRITVYAENRSGAHIHLVFESAG